MKVLQAPSITSANGQIALIAAAALVVLLGIGALAIDLGFSWMLHRQIQNAADPGAIAAARWIDDATGSSIQTQLGAGLVGGPAREAACAYARENGLFPDAADNTGCVPANDPDGATLTVKFPPDANAGLLAGSPGHVQVILTRSHETFFSRIFGVQRANLSEQAVASRQRGTTSTNSLHILDPTGCDSLNLHGTPTIHIYPGSGVTEPGGSVQLNSNCSPPGTAAVGCSNHAGALRIDGTGASLWAQKVNVVGSCRTTQNDEPHPTSGLKEAASPVGDPLGSLRFPTWDLSAAGARCGIGGPQTAATLDEANGCGNNPMDWEDAPCADDPLTAVDESNIDCVTLQPGVYYGGWRITTGMRVNLQPGIYVIAGGGITIAGSGSLDSIAAGVGPAPVLIFNTDNPAAVEAGLCPASNNAGCQANIDLSTNVSLQLAGLGGNQACPPVTSSTAPDCPFGGMVIWYDGEGSQAAARSGNVQIKGGTTLFISGTIYSPYATVEITGNSGTNTASSACPAGATQVLTVQIVTWRLDIGGTGDLCMPYDPSKQYQPRQQGLVH